MKATLILTFALALAPGVVVTCPGNCECGSYETFTRATCAGYEDNFVTKLDKMTNELSLSRVNEEEFDLILMELDNLKLLTKLVVTNCEFNCSEFSKMSYRIVSLSMNNCELKVVPRFYNNSLASLDLSFNKLELIFDKSFESLNELQKLNLSFNVLKVLDNQSLRYLTNLKTLDLSWNLLETILDDVFVELRALQTLNLSNNRLDGLNENTFKGLKLLQLLDLTGNNLKRASPGSLHLPNLRVLLLRNNSNLSNSKLLLGNNPNLQHVDATNVNLQRIPQSLTHSIKTLRIARNDIKQISCGDMDSYPLLQLLDVSNSNLEKIDDDALGLSNMSILYLNRNNLTEIPGSLPETLRVLHLEFNSIERISNLGELTSLEVLLLNDNKIKIITQNSLDELTSLVTLDLSRNPIIALPPGALTIPEALQVLRLSSINLVISAEEVAFPFTNVDSLIILDVSDSPGLAKLFLSDTASLVACRKLQELNLKNNQIVNVRSDLLHLLPQLTVLNLNNNKLNCSKLQWLAKWMRRQEEVMYRDVMCFEPQDVSGTSLVDLQDN